MIDKLCKRIWENKTFQNDFRTAIMLNLSNHFENKALIVSTELKNSISKLLQSALTFALSDNEIFRKAAYEIAIRCRNILRHSATRKNLQDNNSSFETIISLIFSRLGNFPAENKLLSETIVNLNKVLPRELWFERENHIHDNTVYLSPQEKIILTDFQTQLWEAMVVNNVVIVNAPTSIGKSFVLQNFIISELCKSVIKNVIYIVPTRALIEQVVNDLNKIILKIKANNICVTEVPNIETGVLLNIFVLTQERTQIILEQNFIVDFVIIDEAQNIADSARGIILQTVIENLTLRNPDLKLLFATPFVKNPKVFLSLFNLSHKNYAVIPIGESPVLQNLFNVTTKQYISSELQINKIDGDKEELIATIQSNFELVDEKKILSQIALTLGNYQNNIIYGSEPGLCEKMATLISQAFTSSNNQIVDNELSEFSDYIKEHVHKDYLLADTVKVGVVYHYGNLPAFIRKGIDTLCAKGKIKYIVCTSTLLQGVNLPAQNIFIMKPTKGYVGRQAKPLEVTEFWNLAGRAGRLTKDYEGNIYLVNLKQWDMNPLLIKDKQQFVIPSFKKYICDVQEDLVGFINDKNHASGLPETQGKENAFLKLAIAYKKGKHIEILNSFGDSLTPAYKKAIEDCIIDSFTGVTLPIEIIEKNPNISIYRQQELYDYMLKRISEKGAEYLIPPHPMQPYKLIEKDYLRLFLKYDKYFAKTKGKSYIYYKTLAILWMKGVSYAQLLDKRIENNNGTRKKGQANVNTEARGLFEEIEHSLRFKYVKFSKCYNDLLEHVLKTLNLEKYISSIPPLHLYLELGASSKTMISLISLGMSRTGAAQLCDKILVSTMNRAEIKKWFRTTNIYSFGLPQSLINELEHLGVVI